MQNIANEVVESQDTINQFKAQESNTSSSEREQRGASVNTLGFIPKDLVEEIKDTAGK